MQVIEWSWQRSDLPVILKPMTWHKLHRVNRIQNQKQDKIKLNFNQFVRVCQCPLHPVHQRLWFLLLLSVQPHILYSKSCHWQLSLFRKFSAAFCLSPPQNMLIIIDCVLAAASKVKALCGSELLLSQLLAWHGHSLHFVNCRSLGSTRRLNALTSFMLQLHFQTKWWRCRQQVGTSCWTWTEGPAGCDSLTGGAADWLFCSGTHCNNILSLRVSCAQR